MSLLSKKITLDQASLAGVVVGFMGFCFGVYGSLTFLSDYVGSKEMTLRIEDDYKKYHNKQVEGARNGTIEVPILLPSEAATIEWPDYSSKFVSNTYHTTGVDKYTVVHDMRDPMIDWATVAYSKKFAERYELDEDHVREIHEYVGYIEISHKTYGGRINKVIKVLVKKSAPINRSGRVYAWSGDHNLAIDKGSLRGWLQAKPADFRDVRHFMSYDKSAEGYKKNQTEPVSAYTVSLVGYVPDYLYGYDLYTFAIGEGMYAAESIDLWFPLKRQKHFSNGDTQSPYKFMIVDIPKDMRAEGVRINHLDRSEPNLSLFYDRDLRKLDKAGE